MKILWVNVCLCRSDGQSCVLFGHSQVSSTSVYIMYSPSTSVDDISSHPAPESPSSWTLVFYVFFCWIYWILGLYLLFGLHHFRLFGLHSLLDLNHIHQPGLYMPLALVFHMSEVVHMTEVVHMCLVEVVVGEVGEVEVGEVEVVVHMILVEVEVHMLLVEVHNCQSVGLHLLLGFHRIPLVGLHLLLGQHHIHLVGLHLLSELCCLARVRPMLCFHCRAKLLCFHHIVFSLLVHHQSRSGIAFLASDWQDKTRERGGLPPSMRAWWQLQKYFPEG